MISKGNEILKVIGSLIASQFRNALTKKGNNATGKLHNSIESVVEHTLFGVQIDVSASHYAEYLNAGRKKNLKGVPIRALEPWVSVRGLDLRGRSARSVAFAIQASIKKKGIKPSKFIDTAIKKIETSKTIEKNIDKFYDEYIEEKILL